MVGLKRQGHASGVEMCINGAFEETFNVMWKDDISPLELASWKDETQIANFAAVGIAILLVMELLEIVSFEESVIGTGIDFWISTKNMNEKLLPFLEREARLEISGIFQENIRNTVSMRIGKKKKQMKSSDHLQLPGWIVVVELSTPKSKIVRK